jgi:hypothetical protein
VNKPPTEREVKDFLAKNPIRGQFILKRIQEHLPAINEFIKTDFGWQLIKNDVEDLQKSAWIAITGDDPLVRDEYRIRAKMLIQRLSTRVSEIENYMNDIAEIKGEKTDGKKM